MSDDTVLNFTNPAITTSADPLSDILRSGARQLPERSIQTGIGDVPVQLLKVPDPAILAPLCQYK